MPSKLEYKLLTLFFGLILVGSAVRTSDWVIFEYDRWVESARIERERIENNSPKIQFSGCYPCTNDAVDSILPLQIVFLLLSFGLLTLRKLWSIAISGVPLLVILYGYFDWIRLTHGIVVASEYSESVKTSLTSHLLFNSTNLDFFLLFSVFALFVLLSGLSVRFAVEQVHAKLTRNDQTPRS